MCISNKKRGAEVCFVSKLATEVCFVFLPPAYTFGPVFNPIFTKIRP